MKLIFSLKIPTREQSERMAKAHCKPTVEEKVRDAITMVESGEPSREEWLMLVRLNNELVLKYQNNSITKRELNLLRTLHKALEPWAMDTSEEVLRVASLMHPRK